MNDADIAEWRSLLAKTPVIEGAPTAEQMALLKDIKVAKKDFLEKLEGDAKKEAKRIEKELAKSNKPPGKEKQKVKKQQPQKPQKPKISDEQREKNKQGKKDKKLLDALCKWLEIGCKFHQSETEVYFEIKLPKRLAEDDDFLDKYDLDEGWIMVDPDELRRTCEGAVDLLCKQYFGEEYEREFDLANLAERCETKKVLIQRDALPPWYMHMSWPLTPAEIDAST